MQPFATVETTPTVTFKVSPNPDLMLELRLLEKELETRRLAEIVRDEYTWESQENKRVALEHTEALQLAAEMALSIQVNLNLKKVFDMLTKDMAESAFHLARLQLGYTGQIQYIHQIVTPGRSFKRPHQGESFEWVFYPLNQFSKLIPVHALKAKKVMETTTIVQPEDYWVADLVGTPVTTSSYIFNSSSYERRSTTKLDPILCVQYGEWLAGIAMWL